MALVFPYDHSRDPMNPAQLGNQIATALGLANDPLVDINPTQIIVTHPNVTEQNRTAIQTVINSYVFDPVWQGGILAVLQAKAVTALTTNAAYLGHAAVPAGTLTLAQLSTIVRLLADQLDATTRQNTALIRIVANLLDSTSGT